MKTYLITGGTGFIGSYVARELIGKGAKVVLYDVSPNEQSLRAALSKENKDKPIIVRGNILDLGHLIHTIKKYNPVGIIHMAYLLYQASKLNPSLAIKVNCIGTNNLFEAVRLTDISTKIAWASSCTVFGAPERHKEEYLSNDAPHYPPDIYGATKSFMERMAEFYFHEYGVDSIALRFSPVYGAGMQEGTTATLIRELIVKPALGNPGKVPFGDDVVNWLYVEDAARVLVMAANQDEMKTKAFNVNGDLRAVKEAADYVMQRIPNADLTLEPGYWGLCFKYDTSLLEEEIGFKPKFSMEEGINEIIDIVRNRRRGI